MASNPQKLAQDFLNSVPIMPSLRDITDLQYYRDVPADWCIAITDVRNSTIAIENGRYKAVNTVAAVTITALLNAVPDLEIPFMFGGDGASVVIPPEVVPQAWEALSAIIRLARQNFDLNVRAGLVPVKDVIAGGFQVKVGKLKVNDAYSQPVFTGGGMDFADSLIKMPQYEAKYLITERPDSQADFTGFECRWSKHPASNGEVLSLMVKSTSRTPEERTKIYRNVIDKIHDLYGEHEDRHPISLQKMRPATEISQYQNELGWKQELVTFRDRLYLMVYSMGGLVLWKYVHKIWDRYRKVVRATTDHEKFDDTLRMTISGTESQRQELRDYLDIYKQMGDLIYGMHTAEHSLMTCIVFDRFGRQVHFLDADAGGYAMAAKEMKLQLKTQTLQTLKVDL